MVFGIFKSNFVFAIEKIKKKLKIAFFDSYKCVWGRFCVLLKLLSIAILFGYWSVTVGFVPRLSIVLTHRKV